MSTKAIMGIVALQMFFLNSVAWADSDQSRPEISDFGEDRNAGVIIVVALTLLIIGFGVGFLVGRQTSREDKRR